MKTVTVEREALMERVAHNLRAHQEEYRLADEGWRLEFEGWLAETLRRVRAAQPVEVCFTGRRPLSHEADYVRALKMLEMSVHNDIELSEQDFCRLVMDEWSWMGDFKEVTRSYNNMT